jgi:hypothetical protein
MDYNSDLADSYNIRITCNNARGTEIQRRHYFQPEATTEKAKKYKFQDTD